jgi:hypothetical protein
MEQERMINLSAKIHIPNDTLIDVSNANMVSLSCPIFDREKKDLPSWGVVSSKGKMSFYDSEFQVQELIKEKLINDKVTIEVYLNNTLAKKSNKIGEYSSSNWSYDNDSRLVTIVFSDDLTEWQEISVPEISPTLSPNLSLLDLFNDLKTFTPYKWTFEVDEETLDFIKGIKIDETPANSGRSYYYLNSGSLWVQWDKFCQVAMLHIYKNEKGNVVVKHFI